MDEKSNADNKPTLDKLLMGIKSDAWVEVAEDGARIYSVKVGHLARLAATEIKRLQAELDQARAAIAALRAQLADAQAQIEVYKVACNGAAALGVMGEIMREEFDAAIKQTQDERDRARAALAEADKAATERACAAVCWMCKDDGNWHLAEQTPEEFMDESQPPIWGHRPRRHYENKTEWAFKTCDAEKIRAAAQPPAPATPPGGEE